jgi:hypothetical protein
MPIKRYKAEQIVTILRQIEVGIANGKLTPQACKEAEITVQTFYRVLLLIADWRNRQQSVAPARPFSLRCHDPAQMLVCLSFRRF